ncbi:hypothetical protein ACJJIF_09350 [Microbulbifer sp. SSSA002]|uniref:hypothetical protein n=1 Tax=Microbulbifer sp. SSSA002 TaxID=3243376 RepID=UPI00403A5DFF
MSNLYHDISALTEGSLTEEEVADFCSAQSLGDFWLFEHTAHVPDSKILNFSSMTEMETHLLGEGSILNAFTTYAVAVVNGNVRNFEIARDAGSDTILFSKDEQLESSNPFEGKQYPWYVRWSNA